MPDTEANLAKELALFLPFVVPPRKNEQRITSLHCWIHGNPFPSLPGTNNLFLVIARYEAIPSSSLPGTKQSLPVIAQSLPRH